MTTNQNAFYKGATVESIKRGTFPNIIFGAGILGEILFHACRLAGITIDGFADDKIKGYLMGRKVFHTSELRIQYPDAVFFLASSNIKDMTDRLADLGYSKWCSCGLVLRDLDLSKIPPLPPKFSRDYLDYLISTCLLSHDNFLNPGRLFLRSVDLVITERCSLKCRDCSNLMQYYKEPQNSDFSELIHTIDVFCACMDEIYEFRVIGGEPFMNRDCHRIVDKLVREPKIRKVAIFTNGTLVPNDVQIKSLKNKKVLLFITDYGVLSRKLTELTQALQQEGVAFYVDKAQAWRSCSAIRKFNRAQAQQEKVFKSCCAKNLATLSNGKLFRCPFAANAVRLKAVPDFAGDSIDLNRISPGIMDVLEEKKRLYKFLFVKNYLEACDYCAGRPYGAPEITPAVQINKPLEYECCG